MLPYSAKDTLAQLVPLKKNTTWIYEQKQMIRGTQFQHRLNKLTTLRLATDPASS